METETAAPSTREIVADVVSQAESQDTSTESATTSASDTRIDTTTTPEVSEPKTQPTPAEISAAAKFLEKQGHRLRKEDGRDNWLKASTVEGMLDRYVEDHKTTWTSERSTIEGRAKELENGLTAIQRAIREGDETEFIKELATINPKFARFLEQQAQPTPAIDENEPKPDIDLGNGSWTYSQAQNDKRIEWKARQLLDERLKPFEEREKQEQQRAKEREFQDKLNARTASVMEDAKTWPGWSEHAPEILASMQEESKQGGPLTSVEAHYRKIVMAKFLEDDGKKRERLLKEIQAAPKAPALSRQSTDAPKATQRTSKDIVRETLAKLEGA